MKAKSAPSNCSCGKPRAKAWHLACPECWALVPTPLQDKVYRLFKTERGSSNHIEAISACYRVIHASRNAKA